MTAPANVFLDNEKLSELGINIREDQGDKMLVGNNMYQINITNKEKAALNLPAGYPLTNYIREPEPSIFPYYDTSSNWSADNYGPLTIPKRGSTIELTPDNLIRYGRCIQVYEGNKLEQQGDKFLINGQLATSYQFKLNYYWMMGDNRHMSLDSRYWGFVPEDHIVGKASMIWFSWENGPRWNRIFNQIK